MDRDEHIKWCKTRALEYVGKNELDNAWSSMASDLGKHEETADHIGIQMGMMIIMTGGLSTNQEMRKFIEGFN